MSTRAPASTDRENAPATAAALPIRPGMDVFSSDQRRYLGTVVDVIYAGSVRSAGLPRSGNPTGSEGPTQSAELRHEQGATTDTAAPQTKHTLGEEEGPVPTIALGNTGPVNQSAAHAYATDPGSTQRAVASFAVRPGRVNLGFLTPPFYVPIGAVRTISLERIIVDVPGGEIPEAWKQRP